MSSNTHNGGPLINDGGWYAVSRDMLDHPFVGAGHPVSPADPNRGAYSRYEAMSWLISNAAYKPRSVNNKGHQVLLNPGELMASRSFLCKAWNWSEMTVRWFLNQLEIQLTISRYCNQQKANRKTNLNTVIKLQNYERYQIANYRERETEKPAQQPPEQPANNQPTTSQQPELNKGTNKQGNPR